MEGREQETSQLSKENRVRVETVIWKFASNAKCFSVKANFLFVCRRSVAVNFISAKKKKWFGKERVNY